MKDEELLTRQQYDKDHRYECPIHGPLRNDHVVWFGRYKHGNHKYGVCRECHQKVKLRLQ